MYPLADANISAVEPSPEEQPTTVTSRFPPSPSAAPVSAPLPSAGGYPDRRSNGYGRVTGGISLAYAGTFDASEANRDTTELGVRYDVAAREIAGQPLEAHVRGTNRQIDRTGLARGIDEVGDQLDIVFGDLVSVIAARAVEARRLRSGLDQGRLGSRRHVRSIPRVTSRL